MDNGMIRKINFKLRRGVWVPNLGMAVVEGLIFFVYLVLLPKDPKNNLFLGLSSQRLLLIAGVIAITLVFVFLFIYFRRFSAKQLESIPGCWSRNTASRHY